MAITRNAQYTATFPMRDATTKQTLPGLSVTAYITKDGGTENTATYPVSGLGAGRYSLLLSATEMDAGTIQIRLTATGALDQYVWLCTDADSPGVTTLVSRIGTPAGASVSADIAAVASNAALARKLRTNKTIEASDGTWIDVYDDDGVTKLGRFTWDSVNRTRGKLT